MTNILEDRIRERYETSRLHRSAFPRSRHAACGVLALVAVDCLYLKRLTTAMQKWREIFGTAFPL